MIMVMAMVTVMVRDMVRVIIGVEVRHLVALLRRAVGGHHPRGRFRRVAYPLLQVGLGGLGRGALSAQPDETTHASQGQREGSGSGSGYGFGARVRVRHTRHGHTRVGAPVAEGGQRAGRGRAGGVRDGPRGDGTPARE